MKVSVVIPTYNRADFVARAIESVLEQSYKPFEIVVVDDGSSDATYKKLQNYPIRYIYQNNRGVSAARNKGIKAAKSEWIALLDSDDIWHKSKLLKQVAFHKNNPHILFSHTHERWIRNGVEKKYSKRLKKPSGWCFWQNLDACKIACSSVMIHKSVFEDVGLFDESLRVCEDYEMWLRISQKYEIGFLNEKLITKYAGHTQLSQTIAFIDKIHLNILQSYTNTPYKEAVLEAIERKKAILFRGAKKHNNHDILSLLKKF